MIKNILLYLIGVYFALTFIEHGYLKFDPEGFWSKAFVEFWGYGLYFMHFIGVLEFLGGIALLVPLRKVIRYGALTLGIVMLGAFITRVSFGASMTDLISIAFNFVALSYLALENGLTTDLEKIQRSRLFARSN